jgi:hypothetical protein
MTDTAVVATYTDDHPVTLEPVLFEVSAYYRTGEQSVGMADGWEWHEATVHGEDIDPEDINHDLADVALDEVRAGALAYWGTP